jgi:16S rRNA (guanine527-N7)-methyltransferase
VDLGSGAGFPAVVLAILGRRVIAIESVAKKCRFLEELKERLDLPNLEIINDRVESALPRLFRNEKSTPAGGFVFTARAFAPLIKILDLTARFAKKYSATYALLKGRTAEDEIAVARSRYDFDAVLHPSKTGDGRIIILTIK